MMRAMDSSVAPMTPMTPMGARTPHAHPALYAVIAGLSGIIIAGAAWVFWPKAGETPTPSPTPLGVVTGGSEYVVYTNEQYGLRVSLPDSWYGFSVETDEDPYADPPGAYLLIRHPAWSAQTPRQDIPILVYPASEWPCISSQDGTCYKGAAPFPPAALASNSTYVFALPPRYNYAFPAGWEEVDELIRDGAVSAFEPTPSR